MNVVLISTILDSASVVIKSIPQQFFVVDGMIKICILAIFFRL